MARTEVNSNNGIGIFSLTALAFVILKLTDTIDWSWWWVFAPLWMPTVLALLLILLGILAMGLADFGKWLVHEKPKGSRR